MQVNTRAGTHFESAYIPNAAFPATLRGLDQTAWYTLAWFDRWVKGDGSADRRLLTDRWRKDPVDAGIDPAGQGNLFSPTLRSRVDIVTRQGSRAVCEDLRNGCGLLVDDRAGPFSALDFAYGRQTLAPVRPASCASVVRAPRRLDLSRSRRRLRLRLELSQPARVSAHLKRLRPRVRGFRRTRTLAPGRRTIVLRVRRRGRPGRYRVKVGMRCVSGRQSKLLRLRVVR